MENKNKKNIWSRVFDNKIGKSISLFTYFKQSFMATLFLLVFFLVWNSFIPLKNQIIFSAIASSTFLTFISTTIYDSLSKKIIGGQFIGVLIGIILWHLMHIFMQQFPQNENEVMIVFISFSVGFAMLFMSIFNFEHPPAAGTAMAFVLDRQTPAVNDFLFVMVCATLLGITHHYLKKYRLIKDLQGTAESPKVSRLKRIAGFIRHHRKKNRQTTDL